MPSKHTTPKPTAPSAGKTKSGWKTLLAQWEAVAKVKTAGAVSVATMQALAKKYAVKFPAEYVELLTTFGELSIDTGEEAVIVYGPKSMGAAVEIFRERLDRIAENTSEASVRAARGTVPLFGYRDTFPNGAFVVTADGKVREASGKTLELSKPLPFRKALMTEVGTLAPVDKKAISGGKVLLALHGDLCAAFPKHIPSTPTADGAFINIVLEKAPSFRAMFSGDATLVRLECSFPKIVQTAGKGGRFKPHLADADFEQRASVEFALVRKFPSPGDLRAADVVAAVKEAKALAKLYG